MCEWENMQTKWKKFLLAQEDWVGVTMFWQSKHSKWDVSSQYKLQR